ncbi:MAG TPA: response regulator [Vicinamibacteria bacterium]|nr:response regulator [Vicinamibacteria bacterium]
MALILAVDDEEDIRSLLEMQVEGAGHQVLLAGNGVEALQKVESHRPDLVLLDVVMPVMDGLQMLEKLRAEPATRELPVIAVSGRLDGKTIARLQALGVRGLVRKPHSNGELQDRIREALQSVA